MKIGIITAMSMEHEQVVRLLNEKKEYTEFKNNMYLNLAKKILSNSWLCIAGGKTRPQYRFHKRR